MAQSTTDALSLCPECGATVPCGMAQGKSECWCARYPNVLTVPATPEGASCLCENCLQKRLLSRFFARSPAA